MKKSSKQARYERAFFVRVIISEAIDKIREAEKAQKSEYDAFVEIAQFAQEKFHCDKIKAEKIAHDIFNIAAHERQEELKSGRQITFWDRVDKIK